ncbi:hybrid sensor histidine kinase/response regulator [Magnetovirga frankeli]|uniref:hybrid sensor histidine kinase/response regulator n=1 Tax=Magnetovirga frankeli TaxID=947516 RepID=UPI001292FBEA|nr:hybrid sensor histidine kinase/response regulator [gamma proteobacterium SS-5]
MALDMSRFINRFVDEAREHLATLEQGLTDLEASPDDAELINALFRSAHTIKGGSRMLKLGVITDLAHQMEDLLGALREGSLGFTGELARLLERCLDYLSGLIDQVAAKQPLPPLDAELSQALKAALEGGGAAPAAEVRTQPAAGPETPTSDAPAASAKPTKAADSVRVRMDKLDDLIKLMGELVSNQALLQQLSQGLDQLNGQLRRQADDLDRPHLTALRGMADELRELVSNQDLLMLQLNGQALNLRMLPLASAFENSARMVRELGRSLGKEVRCQVSGAEIELDRQMIARLADPLVHILRNAVDHGLETPEVRQAVGKPSHGTLSIEARQDGSAVLLEISDDGVGLNLERIRSKAVQKNLISAEQAASLTEDQALDLVFLPGFSTSPIITDVSGRGVGMDVVKRTIVDELHGVIQVHSQAGKGSLFQIRLPLSLAVMRVMLCQAGGQTFGFTAQYIHELVRVPAREQMNIAGRQAFALHNEFIPLVDLAVLLGLQGKGGEVAARPAGDLVVVVRGRQSKLGLVVDQLLDERDMVITPLPEHLAGLPLVGGMVVTGRNRLVSLLQAPALIERARQLRGESLALADSGPSASPEGPAKQWHILVVDDSLNTREIEKEVLEAHGYQVSLAKDGMDGLRRAQQQQFDAVLTDVEMPHMDGFSLTERLRELPGYGGTPIIIVTSREREEDKRRGIQAGADAYIVKGDFDQSNLAQTLENLLA